MQSLFRKVKSILSFLLRFSKNNETLVKVSDFIGLDKKVTKSIFRYELFRTTLHLNGAILEVGVGSGQGLRMLIRHQEFHLDKREIYAFDSFEGFPKGSKYDLPNFNAQSKPKYKEFSVSFVKEYLLATGASKDKVAGVRFIQGYIPDSLQKFDGSPIALLNLDLDLYQPTLDSLNYFFKYLLPGGVVLLDDYDGDSAEKKWPGVKKAVDEFCRINNLILMRGYGDLTYLQK